MRGSGGPPRHRPKRRRQLDAIGATNRLSAPRFKLRAGLRPWMPMAALKAVAHGSMVSTGTLWTLGRSW
jgi:hypothetical protein